MGEPGLCPAQCSFEMTGCGDRKAFTQFETFAAYGELIARRGIVIVQVDKDLHHRLRRDGVSTEGGVARRGQSAHTERRRRSKAGIDKENAFPILQVKRMLNLELEVGEAFNIRQIHRLDALDEQWTECIITAAGIAPAEN